MKFILTNVSTGEQQSVTRECVDRVKGKIRINQIVKEVEQSGKCVELHFEGEYDLMVALKN